MVSIISMPLTVAASSFPASRICTRVMFMRLFEITRDMTAFSASVTMPISVRIGLWVSINTR